jgi:23S rRNA pseudouridine1911/1915/1917 synthase
VTEARTVVVDVPESLVGERIDRIVAMVTDVSRTEAARLVAAGAVALDGVVATRGADRLTAAAEVTIEIGATPAYVGPTPDPSVEIPSVYVDEHVIVIDKPADMVIHPGAGHTSGTLANGLLAAYPEIAQVGDPDRPGIVHRLDRGTSGVLMVARSQVAYDSLVEQLADRSVDRQYRTLVWGHPESPRGVVDAPIGRSPKHPTKMAITEKGKPARTRYEVEVSYHDPVVVSEVVCKLETGRTHQIRVHMAAIGHAVVGDDRYRGARQSLPMARPFLHAERLGFDHPVTGERLEFTSDLPEDLTKVRNRLS